MPSSLTTFRVRVPVDAPVTQPYYLKQPRSGDVYKWTDADPKSLPFDPPLLTATVAMTIGGADITITRQAACQCHYARQCRTGRRCIEDIGVDEVIAAVERRVARG